MLQFLTSKRRPPSRGNYAHDRADSDSESPDEEDQHPRRVVTTRPPEPRTEEFDPFAQIRAPAGASPATSTLPSLFPISAPDPIASVPTGGSAALPLNLFGPPPVSPLDAPIPSAAPLAPYIGGSGGPALYPDPGKSCLNPTQRAQHITFSCQ
jgi:hypothetical protein